MDEIFSREADRIAFEVGAVVIAEVVMLCDSEQKERRGALLLHEVVSRGFGT